MTALWLLTSCLAGWAKDRARAISESDRQAGALSLEWVVIAVALVAAAGVATLLITNAIKSAGSTLP